MRWSVIQPSKVLVTVKGCYVISALVALVGCAGTSASTDTRPATPIPSASIAADASMWCSHHVSNQYVPCDSVADVGCTEPRAFSVLGCYATKEACLSSSASSDAACTRHERRPSDDGVARRIGEDPKGGVICFARGEYAPRTEELAVPLRETWTASVQCERDQASCERRISEEPLGTRGIVVGCGARQVALVQARHSQVHPPFPWCYRGWAFTKGDCPAPMPGTQQCPAPVDSEKQVEFCASSREECNTMRRGDYVEGPLGNRRNGRCVEVQRTLHSIAK